MGEVIKANFGGGKKEQPEKSDNPHEEVVVRSRKKAILENFEDMTYAIENLDRINMAKARIDEITDYIFDTLKGYTRDDESIELRREGLRAASMESLVGHLVDSTQQDWKMHPSFYGAVILEYRDKVDQALSLLGSDDESD